MMQVGDVRGYLLFAGENRCAMALDALGEQLIARGVVSIVRARRDADFGEMIDDARNAFVNFSHLAGRVTVIGQNEGVLMALAVAEGYPVEALVCLDVVLRPRKQRYALMHLARHVRRNLFSVVAPTLIVQALDAPTSDPTDARALYQGIGARRAKLMWIKRADALRDKAVLETIIQQTCHINDTGSLAKGHDLCII
ncbi:MAG: hypothetical protein RR296_02090 [Clostridia bacterium]